MKKNIEVQIYENNTHVGYLTIEEEPRDLFDLDEICRLATFLYGVHWNIFRVGGEYYHHKDIENALTIYISDKLAEQDYDEFCRWNREVYG